MRPRIFLVSPYAGDTPVEFAANEEYLRLCMRDSIARGEAPFAAHGLYPTFLDDADTNERALGMACGMSWLEVAWKCAVYEDRGLSPGMLEDMKQAARMNVIIEYRRLDE